MTRAVLLGSPALVEGCAPEPTPGFDVVRLAGEPDDAALAAAAADAIVAFAPSPAARDLIARCELPAAIWWPDEAPVTTPRPEQRTVVAAAAREGVWRSAPLPVADSLYTEDEPAALDRAAWLGPPTARRAEYLSHFADGVRPAEDDPAAGIAVNIHDGRPACEHRALVALAQGRLLVSETLAPSRGLEPGIDYLEARDLDDVFLMVENAVRTPEAFRRVRVRGRRKAELFRASRVVPRIVGDLLLELGRAPVAGSTP